MEMSATNTAPSGFLGGILRGGVLILLLVLSAPMLTISGYLFSYWFRIHTSDVFYAEYPYLTFAFVSGAAGLFCLTSIIRAALQRTIRMPSLALIPVLTLTTAILAPDGQPFFRGYTASENYLGNFETFSRVWYEQHHAFPGDKQEIDDAFTAGRALWHNRIPKDVSEFRQRGRVVPFDLVVVNDAKGPKTEDLSDRPGVVYYSVASDRQEIWVTATGLNTNVASRATIHRAGIQRSYGADRPEIVHVTGAEILRAQALRQERLRHLHLTNP